MQDKEAQKQHPSGSNPRGRPGLVFTAKVMEKTWKPFRIIQKHKGLQKTLFYQHCVTRLESNFWCIKTAKKNQNNICGHNFLKIRLMSLLCRFESWDVPSWENIAANIRAQLCSWELLTASVPVCRFGWLHCRKKHSWSIMDSGCTLHNFRPSVVEVSFRNFFSNN